MPLTQTPPMVRSLCSLHHATTSSMLICFACVRVEVVVWGLAFRCITSSKDFHTRFEKKSFVRAFFAKASRLYECQRARVCSAACGWGCGCARDCHCCVSLGLRSGRGALLRKRVNVCAVVDHSFTSFFIRKWCKREKKNDTGVTKQNASLIHLSGI